MQLCILYQPGGWKQEKDFLSIYTMTLARIRNVNLCVISPQEGGEDEEEEEEASSQDDSAVVDDILLRPHSLSLPFLSLWSMNIFRLHCIAHKQP